LQTTLHDRLSTSATPHSDHIEDPAQHRLLSAPGITPFTIELLGNNHEADFSDLLPAATRSFDDELLLLLTSNGILEFLSKDVSVHKLDKIHKQLWMAGRLMPPKHLCYQIALSRDVVLSEEMDLHLV
jgi:hypothetical protein